MMVLVTSSLVSRLLEHHRGADKKQPLFLDIKGHNIIPKMDEAAISTNDLRSYSIHTLGFYSPPPPPPSPPRSSSSPSHPSSPILCCLPPLQRWPTLPATPLPPALALSTLSPTTSSPLFPLPSPPSLSPVPPITIKAASRLSPFTAFSVSLHRLEPFTLYVKVAALPRPHYDHLCLCGFHSFPPSSAFTGIVLCLAHCVKITIEFLPG